jgi:hypothetical protein
MGFDKKWYGHPTDPDCPTEFSWGPGLVPPGKENAPPSEGGMCRPKAPDMTEPRPCRYRRGDPPPGYPGDPVAQ